MPVATRPMTPAERYYAFLDHAWPMNTMLVAELDQHLPADVVEDRWRAFFEVRALSRAIATPDLTIADGGPARIDFRASEASPDTWDAELARESLVAYGCECAMRCRLLTSPERDRSRLFLVGHHSVIGGRSGIAELQAFIRFLDGQPEQRQDDLPAPAQSEAGRYPWQTDKKQLIALLRDIAARNRSAGPPQPDWWPSSELDRLPRFAPATFGADQSQCLLQRAKAHGARAFSSMASAWLLSAAEHVVGQRSATIQLNTPVDVSTPSHRSGQPPGMAVGVLSHRFAVQVGSPWPLAADIADAVALSLELGEGDLFFELTRADRVGDLEAGARLVAASLATAPPAVSVTNLGVVDPGPDPAWLRSMCVYQAPTPNQIAFVSGLGYRGRLVNSLATDDHRLPPTTAAALLAGFGSLIDQMSGPAPDQISRERAAR